MYGSTVSVCVAGTSCRNIVSYPEGVFFIYFGTKLIYTCTVDRCFTRNRSSDTADLDGGNHVFNTAHTRSGSKIMSCISVFSAIVGYGTAICRALMPVVSFVHRPIRRPAMLMCATGAKTIYKAMFRIIGKSAHICSRIASRSGTLAPVMGIIEVPIAGHVYVGNVIHVDIDDCLSTIGGVNHCKGLGKISHIGCRQKVACKVKLAVRSKFISSRSIQVELEHIRLALAEYHAVYCGVVIIYGTETRRNKSSPIAAVHIDRHPRAADGNVVIRHFTNDGLGEVADSYRSDWCGRNGTDRRQIEGQPIAVFRKTGSESGCRTGAVRRDERNVFFFQFRIIISVHRVKFDRKRILIPDLQYRARGDRIAISICTITEAVDRIIVAVQSSVGRIGWVIELGKIHAFGCGQRYVPGGFARFVAVEYNRKRLDCGGAKLREPEGNGSCGHSRNHSILKSGQLELIFFQIATVPEAVRKAVAFVQHIVDL